MDNNNYTILKSLNSSIDMSKSLIQFPELGVLNIRYESIL